MDDRRGRRHSPNSVLAAGLALAAMCAVILLCAPAAQASSSGNPRLHSLTDEDADAGCAHYNLSFGCQNWKYVAQFIDLAIASGQTNTWITQGGIATAFYADFNDCSGTQAESPNPYAQPDCKSWNPTAFYDETGYPSRPLTIDQGILQRILNPGSAQGQSLSKAYESGMLATGAYKYATLDESDTPDEGYYGAGLPFCYGFGTYSGSGYSCAGSAAAPAAPPWHDGYTRNQWIAGEIALVNSMPVPQFLNGLAANTFQATSPESLSAAVSVITKARNAAGGSCDACFYAGGNRFLVSGDILTIRLNNVLSVVGAGKMAVITNEDDLNVVDRQQALAISMLAYAADLMFFRGAPCGKGSAGGQPGSYINACPESALTFYDPYNSYPRSAAALHQANGSLLREFAHCFNHGVALGPCAAIVNPSPYDAIQFSARFPSGNTYTNSLAIAGTGLCDCYGDKDSSVAENGPFPAGNTLPPATGYVLFTSSADRSVR